MYSILSSANNDSFTSSFSNSDSVCFSSLIAIARTSKTMLNRSGKSGHPSLVPDLKGNAFTLSLLSIMLAVGLSYMTFEVCTQIPQKGNAKECSDYHTIVFISHASKVMLKILQARLQQYINRELPVFKLV